jgi:ABC-type spermidine/putrescine transport system permease subunit I
MAEHPEIAIRVRTIGQLFNTFDPSPFREKDLDNGVEDFLVGWVRELPPSTPFRILVHLPQEEAAKPEAAEIPAAFAHYFRDRGQASSRELRELLRIGWRSLLIGLVVLVICLVASQIAAKGIANATLARVVEESLIIVGWVANWRPIEIYLYEWWPIVRRRRLYRRIAAAHVRVRAS